MKKNLVAKVQAGKTCDQSQAAACSLSQTFAAVIAALPQFFAKKELPDNILCDLAWLLCSDTQMKSLKDPTEKQGCAGTDRESLSC